VKALPGNPYDGHTLASVIPDIETLIGNTIARILADKGYRGHNAPPDYKFRVVLSGQKRGVTPKIKRELRRRSAVEPVIISKPSTAWAATISGSAGRRGQRHPRRRLQLPPSHPLAQAFVAPIPDRTLPQPSDSSSVKSAFFVDDCVRLIGGTH
jgi:hypothetical protein